MIELTEHSFEDKDELHNNLVNKKNNETDNIHSLNDTTSLQYEKLIYKDEEEKTIKRIKKNRDEEEKIKKTIMDMTLKDILSKTSDTTSNFLEDYKIKLVEAKYEYEKKNKVENDTKTSISNFLTIHSLALVKYMKENDNIIYIGIFLIFISVIIYIFNITSS